MTQWTLYTRAECDLCEVFIAELAQLLGTDAEQALVIDIDGDAELERKYARRIPVLLADGDFVCSYQLDVQRVRHYLP